MMKSQYFTPIVVALFTAYVLFARGYSIRKIRKLGNDEEVPHWLHLAVVPEPFSIEILGAFALGTIVTAGANRFLFLACGILFFAAHLAMMVFAARKISEMKGKNASKRTSVV